MATITEPKEILKAVRKLVYADRSEEKMEIKTSNFTMIRDVDSDGNIEYRVYGDNMAIFGNGVRIDEMHNTLYIYLMGRIVGYHDIFPMSIKTI